MPSPFLPSSFPFLSSLSLLLLSFFGFWDRVLWHNEELALNSQPSCLILPSTEIPGVKHHAWLQQWSLIFDFNSKQAIFDETIIRGSISQGKYAFCVPCQINPTSILTQQRRNRTGIIWPIISSSLNKRRLLTLEFSKRFHLQYSSIVYRAETLPVNSNRQPVAR